MTTDNFLVFLHILSTSMVLGGECLLQFVIYPIIFKTNKKDDILLKIYDLSIPLIFGFVILLLISGVLLIFRSYSYFQDVSSTILLALGIKFGIIVLVFSISIYQSFSLRAQITGTHPFKEKVNDTTLMIKKSRFFSMIVIVSIMAAMLAGIYIN